MSKKNNESVIQEVENKPETKTETASKFQLDVAKIDLVCAIEKDDMQWTIKVVNEFNKNMKSHYGAILRDLLTATPYSRVNKSLLYAIKNLSNIENREVVSFYAQYYYIELTGDKETYIKLVDEVLYNKVKYEQNELADLSRLCVRFNDTDTLSKIRG